MIQMRRVAPMMHGAFQKALELQMASDGDFFQRQHQLARVGKARGSDRVGGSCVFKLRL